MTQTFCLCMFYHYLSILIGLFKKKSLKYLMYFNNFYSSVHWFIFFSLQCDTRINLQLHFIVFSQMIKM